MAIFQVGIILGGDFLCENCLGGSYPEWKLSGWELSRVEIFFGGVFSGGNCLGGGIILVAIFQVGVFMFFPAIQF